MIFATVGAQMPFDRLIHALDAWASNQGRDDVFAQVGPTDAPPRHIRWIRFISPGEFRQRIREADIIVAHAGMGTIINALCLRKPLIVMPRRGDLYETRNDHQIATARRFLALGQLSVAMDREELFDRLDHLDAVIAPDGIEAHASTELISRIQTFIRSESPAASMRSATESGETRDVLPSHH